jgi:hypothetical protein
MMKPIVVFLLTAFSLSAQPDLPKLTDELEVAIKAADWPKAAQLSRSLREAVREARDQSMAASGDKLVDSILTWLPADTETLVVAQQPFTLNQADQSKLPGALEMAQGYVLGLLVAAEKETLYASLVGRTVQRAALSARRFGEEPPNLPSGGRGSGLGMIFYQGCAVYAFTEPVPDSVLTRPPDETIMGHRVWVSKGSQRDLPDSDTYFVSLLKPDLMLACNNREFFREMVSRRDGPSQPRALPADLPEWKLVDRTAPLWALCHYAGKGEILLAALGPEFGEVEPTGVTLEFGVAPNGARARMISKSNPWKEFAEASDFHGAAKSRESQAGVWELTVDERPEAALMAGFTLMAVVGFIVAL